MELKDFRNQIDEIDNELVFLLSKRMQVVEQVSAFKKANGIAVLDAGREQALLDRLCAGKSAHEQAEIRQVYAVILNLSKQRQQQ